MYGTLAVLGTMGPWYLLLLLAHCLGLYVASLLGQSWLCLGLGMASLASFKMDPLISWQVCVSWSLTKGENIGIDVPKLFPKDLVHPNLHKGSCCAQQGHSHTLHALSAMTYVRWVGEQGHETGPVGRQVSLPRRGHLVSPRPVLSPPERVCNRHF